VTCQLLVLWLVLLTLWSLIELETTHTCTDNHDNRRADGMPCIHSIPLPSCFSEWLTCDQRVQRQTSNSDEHVQQAHNKRSISDCELVYIRHTFTTVCMAAASLFSCLPLTVLFCVCLEKTAHASTPCCTLYVHCLLLTRKTHHYYYSSSYCCTTAIAVSLPLLLLLLTLLLRFTTVHTSARCSRWLHLYNHTAVATATAAASSTASFTTVHTSGHSLHQTDSQTGRAPRACCGSAQPQYRTEPCAGGFDRTSQCHAASRCAPTALECSYQQELNSTDAMQHENSKRVVCHYGGLAERSVQGKVVATVKYAFLMNTTSYKLHNVRYNHDARAYTTHSITFSC
jgi:hypothetical protein